MSECSFLIHSNVRVYGSNSRSCLSPQQQANGTHGQRSQPMQFKGASYSAESQSTQANRDRGKGQQGQPSG